MSLQAAEQPVEKFLPGTVWDLLRGWGGVQNSELAVGRTLCGDINRQAFSLCPGLAPSLEPTLHLGTPMPPATLNPGSHTPW